MTRARPLIAVALMSVGLVTLVVQDVQRGWTTLGGFGVGCFVIAIAAQLGALRRGRAS